MPDILINPLRTGFLRILLGVNSRLLQSFLEHGVLETQISDAMLMVEGIVAGEYIIVSPSKAPCIESHDTGIEARVPSPLHHGDCLLIIVALIQLKEAGTVAIGFFDILDAVAASRRKTVRQVQLLCNLCDGEFASGVINAVDT